MQSHVIELSHSTNSDLQVPCPDGLEYLPFQRAGIAYATRKGADAVLIADEMGLGKTVQTIGVINTLPEIRSVLVVCPASLRINWQNELLKWLARPAGVAVYGGTWATNAPMQKPEVEVVVINYDVLKKVPSTAKYDLMVIDECQYCKNPQAQRTQLTTRIASRCPRVIALSGTPITKCPADFYPVLAMLSGEFFDMGFYNYAMRYCAPRVIDVPDRSRPQRPGQPRPRRKITLYDGAANLEELQAKLRATVMLRRKKADVLKDLPPKRRAIVALPADAASDLVRLEKESFDGTGYTIEELLSNNGKVVFEEISRIMHETSLIKVPVATQYIINALESGSEKVIVFGHHHDVVDALMAGLAEYNPVRVSGVDSPDDRHIAVNTFQTNAKCRVIVCSIAAGGVGLTLTAASHVLFVERTWTPADITQAEDRAHRIGQKDSVLCEHLVFEGSIDERVTRILVKKQEIANRLLDSDALRR